MVAALVLMLLVSMLAALVVVRRLEAARRDLEATAIPVRTDAAHRSADPRRR